MRCIVRKPRSPPVPQPCEKAQASGMNRPKRDPPPDDAMTNEQVVELVSVQVLAMRAEMNRRFEDVEARLERIEARLEGEGHE